MKNIFFFDFGKIFFVEFDSLDPLGFGYSCAIKQRYVHLDAPAFSCVSVLTQWHNFWTIKLKAVAASSGVFLLSCLNYNTTPIVTHYPLQPIQSTDFLHSKEDNSFKLDFVSTFFLLHPLLFIFLVFYISFCLICSILFYFFVIIFLEIVFCISKMILCKYFLFFCF